MESADDEAFDPSVSGQSPAPRPLLASQRWIASLSTASVVATALLIGCGERLAVGDVPVTVQPTAIIPAPRQMIRAEGMFVLSAETRVAFMPQPQAEQAARYFVDLMRRTYDLVLIPSVAGEPHDNEILFELASSERAVDAEGYALSISPRRIVVAGNDPSGLFYGAVTLAQLPSPAASGEMRIPAMTIHDAPRFRWRGLMLDSARHCQSPQFIRKLIDVMALHKLNVLHWHLVDDQAWRLEIRKHPKLTSVGAWRVPAGPAAAADIDPATGKPRVYGGFYSQEQVRELVTYAAARHITIVPEIEMPGHASAAIVAYPQLAASAHPPRTVPADWGVYGNVFNVEESTFTFLEDVLRETLELFPSEYIHVGGDEVTKDQWRASPAVQRRMRELGIEDENALQSWFISRIAKFLDAHGRRLIGWDEILEGGLAPNATVMSWRGIDGAVAAAAAGHDAVLSPSPTLYFDNRPFATPRPPGRGRVVSVEEVYRFDPAPVALTEAQHEHILGVQANIWTEHIRTEERVEYMAFPRAAALAEVAWSPRERIDWASFSARLPAQVERYESLGVHFAHASGQQASGNPRRTSHELKLCSENLVLSLEDDAPIRGDRAVYLVDIMNPCWIYPGVDLSAPVTLKAAVGQAPFNFQIGADLKKIPLRTPATTKGELEVRLDTCDGAKLAALPLEPAVNTYAVTELPAAKIEAQPGTHDLCFVFTRAQVDPMWLIDSIEIASAAQRAESP